MTKNIEKILNSSIPFLEKVFEALEKDKINVSKYELDHICYRVETLERYEELKKELLEYGTLLNEAQIGGRAISTFKLNKSIIFGERRIWCFELPAPKKGKPYPEGYEHVEFVIDMDFDEFMRLYPQTVFDTETITREINPDISIEHNGFTIKFHHQTLEYVIKNLQ